MEKEAMGGHMMVPLENLSLGLPNGGTVLGHDKVISNLKGSIRVFCRVRPSIPTSNFKIKSPVTVEQEKISVRAVGVKKDFSVDRVFDQESTQDDVFHEVKPILRSALDGHNVCILAFGQTGTGKTFPWKLRAGRN